jgi:23S rRNA pseudouridine1911/1915/1917 synthase
MIPDSGTLDEPRIVFEDECLVAVYKPPRLHTAPLGGGGPDLCAWAFEARPDVSLSPAGSLEGRRAAEGGLFHRLDFETSGLVLFARSPACLASLLEAQASGLVEKEYLADSRPSAAEMPGARPPRGTPGGLDPEAWSGVVGRAAAFVGAGRHSVPDDGDGPTDALKAICVMAAGRSVECRFRPFGPGGSRVACLDPETAVIRGAARRHGSPGTVYRSELAALCATEERGSGPIIEVRVRMLRGFRHQVRAHLAWLGLPLLGDGLYGGAPAGRLHLHAWRLRLPHPRGGSPLVLECPP